MSYKQAYVFSNNDILMTVLTEKHYEQLTSGDIHIPLSLLHKMNKKSFIIIQASLFLHYTDVTIYVGNYFHKNILYWMDR